MLGLTAFALLTVGIFAFEIARQIKHIKLDGLAIINASFLITYSYTGLLFFSNPENVPYAYQEDIKITVALLCFISYCSTISGYTIGRIGTRHSHSSPQHSEHSIAAGGVITFAIGFISTYMYSQSYGGLMNSIIYAAAIRAGYGEDLLVAEGNYLFFKNLIPLLQYLPIILIGRYIANPNKRTLIWFLATFSLAVFGLFLMSGRGRIVIFIILLIVCSSNHKTPKKHATPSRSISIIILIFALDLFISYGKQIFNLFYSDDNSLSAIIAQQEYIPFRLFSEYYEHRVHSIIIALNDTRFSPTLFYDALAIPLYVIPSRITGITAPDSISYINTFLQTGFWDSMIPPGMVAYGFYSLGIAGVIITSFAFGLFPGIFDKTLSSTSSSKQKINFKQLYMPILLIWCIYFIQGDPRVFIINLTPPLIFAAITHLAKRRFVIN
jgi:hypothetical protein